jgi:hypothetical protein
MLLLVDNHYQSLVTARPAARQKELWAPLHVKGAKAVRSDQDVLTQEALLAFSSAPPGLPESFASTNGLSAGVFRIGPSTRPGVAAPLGWALSEVTRRDLDTQLAALATDTDGCAGPGDAVDRTLMPESMRCLMAELNLPEH